MSFADGTNGPAPTVSLDCPDGHRVTLPAFVLLLIVPADGMAWVEFGCITCRDIVTVGMDTRQCRLLKAARARILRVDASTVQELRDPARARHAPLPDEVDELAALAAVPEADVMRWVLARQPLHAGPPVGGGPR